MRKSLLVSLVLALFISCNKKKDPLPEVNGILQPLALDGCTNIIILDDGTRLEPVSNTSGVELKTNQRFSFTYRLKPAPSICMAGKTIEIVSLRYL